MLCADTHCHLDDPAFAGDLTDVIRRSESAGIHPLIAPGESRASSATLLDLAKKFPAVLPCAGVHPHQAGKMLPEDREWFSEVVRQPQVVGVGEIGLDYFYEFSDRQCQTDVCSFFLDLAVQTAKPACLHVRDKSGQDDAARDLLGLLKPRAGKLRGVIHCFTGTWEQARDFLDLGFHLSFTGILTFKKADNVREVFSRAPLDRILLETDAPYLAPEPFRGKRNEPSFLSSVFSTAAQCRNLPEPDLSLRLRQTERELFSISLR